MSESHSLSNSALLSLSVGSIIRAVLTGQDTVGAWKPIVKLRNWTLSSPFKRTVLTVFRKIKYDSPIWPTPVRPNTKATDHNVLSRFFVVMAPITYFSALGTCYIFSRALHPSFVFPRFLSEPRFHATSNMLPSNIGSSYMLSCVLSRERRFHFALALFGSSRPSLHFLTIILKSLSNVDCFDTKFLEIFGVNNKLMGTITW